MAEETIAEFLGINQAKILIVGGMSEYALDNPPDEGDERTYIVKARCRKLLIDEVDGEKRIICQMEHTSIYERGKVPIVDEPKGLFDDPNNPNAGLEEGGSDEAGDGEATDDSGAEKPEQSDGDGADVPTGPEWGDRGPQVSGEPTKAFEGGPVFTSIDGGGGTEE